MKWRLFGRLPAPKNKNASSTHTPSETVSMSEATVRGVIHLIEETKTYGQKGFRKRLVVLEQTTDGGFTNYIPVEFIKDGCDAVDDLKMGDDVEVTYRLSGRRWQRDPGSEAKYFLSAEALNFRVLSGGGSGQAGQFDPNQALAEAAEDDIPF